MSPARSTSPAPHAPIDTRIPLDGTRTLAARVYGRPGRRPAALVLHFHAGAFFAGDLDSGARVATLLAEAGAVVVSLDYPLAPAQPFPAAVEAGHAALEWLWRERGRLAGHAAGLWDEQAIAQRELAEVHRLHRPGDARAHVDALDRLQAAGELVPGGHVVLHHARHRDRRGRPRPPRRRARSAACRRPTGRGGRPE